MEAVFDRQYLAAAGSDERHAQCVLIGFRTGIDEKYPLETGRGDFDQQLGGPGPHLEGHGIALEQEFRTLPRDRCDQRRVAVAEGRYRMPAVQVEDAPAVVGDDVAAGGAYRVEGQLGVDRDHACRFPLPCVPVHLRQVHAGAGAVRPVVSGRPHSRFIHCTAPPGGAFTRLSMTQSTATAPSATVTPICARLLATTSLSRGAPATISTNGHSGVGRLECPADFARGDSWPQPRLQGDMDSAGERAGMGDETQQRPAPGGDFRKVDDFGHVPVLERLVGV